MHLGVNMTQRLYPPKRKNNSGISNGIKEIKLVSTSTMDGLNVQNHEKNSLVNTRKYLKI